MSTTDVVVGRLGKAHGLKGEISVEPRTDEPERRFADGTVLAIEAPAGGAPHGPDRPTALTVESTRWHQSHLLVRFAEIKDRTRAEAARGLLLVATIDLAETPDDPEEFYDHQLVGLQVVTTEGDPVGEVHQIVHGAAQDLISVVTPEGREVLVPFVSELVPLVDVPNRRLVVADRPGLLNPAEPDTADGT